MFDLIATNSIDGLVEKPKAHCSTFNVGVGVGFVHICHDVYIGITVEV